MADKTFSEEEHLAILGDRVANETAELTAKVATLEAENATLMTQNDTLEAAKRAAEQAKADVEQEFADFKVETERAAEIAKVRDERAAQVKGLVGDDFVTEERADRYAAMPESEFAAFVADLQDAKPAKTEGEPSAPSTREAAMSGSPAQSSAGTSGGPSTARELLALQF